MRASGSSLGDEGVASNVPIQQGKEAGGGGMLVRAAV